MSGANRKKPRIDAGRAFRLAVTLLWLPLAFALLVFEATPSPTYLGGRSGAVPFIVGNVVGVPLIYWIRARAAQKFSWFLCAGGVVGVIPAASYFVMDALYGGRSPYGAMMLIGLVLGGLAGLGIAAVFRCTPWQSAEVE